MNGNHKLTVYGCLSCGSKLMVRGEMTRHGTKVRWRKVPIGPGFIMEHDCHGDGRYSGSSILPPPIEVRAHGE